MFGVGKHSGRRPFKYHFTLRVKSVTLRDGVCSAAPDKAPFRLAWKRGDKLASTASVTRQGPLLAFDESIALVCTMYRDGDSPAFTPKSASLTLLHESQRGRSRRKIAAVDLDLAPYAGVEATSVDVTFVLAHDGIPAADVALTITSRWLKNYSRPEGAASLVSDSDASSSVRSYSSSAYSSASGAASDQDADSNAGDPSELDTDDELAAAEEEEVGLPTAPARHASGSRAGSAASSGRRTRWLSNRSRDRSTRAEGARALEEEALVAELKADLASSEERASELETALASARSDSNQYSNAAERAERLLNQARGEVAALQKEMSGMSSALSKAAGTATETQAEAAAARAELASTQAALDAARDSKGVAVVEVEAELKAAYEALTSARTELSKKSAELEVAKLSVVDQAGREASASRLQALEAELSRMRGELERYREGEGNASQAEEASAMAREAAVAAREAAAAGTEVTQAKRSVADMALVLADAQAKVEEARQGEAEAIEREAKAKERESEAVSLLTQLAPFASSDAAAELETLLRRAELAAEAGLSHNSVGAIADALFAAGKAANSVGETWRALLLFEHSFVASRRISTLVSVANMHLKLGGERVALALYDHVIDAANATPREVEVAQRKAGEAQAAITTQEAALAALRDENPEMPHMTPALEKRVLLRSLGMLRQGRKLGGDTVLDGSSDDLNKRSVALREVRVKLAQALADKASLGRELQQQQKLHRRARETQQQLKQTATALEARLAEVAEEQLARLEAEAETATSDAGTTGMGNLETEMLRLVLREQGQQIVDLTQSNSELHAKLAAAETALAGAG